MCVRLQCIYNNTNLTTDSRHGLFWRMDGLFLWEPLWVLLLLLQKCVCMVIRVCVNFCGLSSNPRADAVKPKPQLKLTFFLHSWAAKLEKKELEGRWWWWLNRQNRTLTPPHNMHTKYINNIQINTELLKCIVCMAKRGRSTVHAAHKVYFNTFFLL